jgi:hypothetical protein
VEKIAKAVPAGSRAGNGYARPDRTLLLGNPDPIFSATGHGRACGYVISARESGASYTSDGLARRVRVVIRERSRKEAITVLWTIFVVLLVLWAVGVVSSYTLGGFIHLLLLIAIAVVLIRIIQGRRPI